MIHLMSTEKNVLKIKPKIGYQNPIHEIDVLALSYNGVAYKTHFLQVETFFS